MTNKSAEGCCHICGNFTKLSYEHIPPKSAYNNSPVFVAHCRQLFDGLNIDYEIGNGTVEVYDTIEQLKKERTCVAECGIVEVEVTLKRVVAQRSDGF